MRIRIIPESRQPVDVDALVRVLIDLARDEYRERKAAEKQPPAQPSEQSEAGDD